VDGRNTDGPVDVLGREVPVASLARFNLHDLSGEEATTIDIDPVTRDDEVPESSSFDYPVGPRDFLMTC
jgi:hypothetical protein